MTPPTISLSIIIPTYNRVGLIKFTLDSLQPQFHPGIAMEIIVVDDGSTDGTWDFIEKNYPVVKLYRNDKKGATSARNKGLSMAQGTYIMYLDSDDLVGAGFFAGKIQLLDTQSVYHACYGTYEYFQSDSAFSSDQIIFKYKYPLLAGQRNGKAHLTNFLSGNFTPLNSIIWRKSFLLKIKGHDEKLAINQDVELFIRAIFKGLLITGIDDGTKVYVRHHDVDKRVGDPRNESHKWRQILELRKKIFADLTLYSYNETECFEALSSYLFSHWRMLRHSDAELANAYLDFAKTVYWPVHIKGTAGFRFMSSVLGPVRAVEVKYFLLKRD